MKKLASPSLLGLVLVGSLGISGYAVTRTADETPQCCVKKAAAAPAALSEGRSRPGRPLPDASLIRTPS